MKSAILVLTIAAIAIAAPLETDTDNCIANYLKNINLLTSEFGNDDEYSSFCESFVEIEKHNIHEQLEDALSQDDEMRDHIICMMEHMEVAGYCDEMLVLYVLARDNLTLTEEEKEARKTEIMHNGQKTTMRSYIKCKSSEEFGKIFDSLFEEEKSSEDDDLSDVEDYCMRKHIIENNLVEYPLAENPKGIDITSIECEKIYESVVAKIEEKKTEVLSEIGPSSKESESVDEEESNESDCLVGIIKSGFFIEKLSPFDYIKEFELTDEQKEVEKQKFITIMSELAEIFATSCLS